MIIRKLNFTRMHHLLTQFAHPFKNPTDCLTYRMIPAHLPDSLNFQKKWGLLNFPAMIAFSYEINLTRLLIIVSSVCNRARRPFQSICLTSLYNRPIRGKLNFGPQGNGYLEYAQISAKKTTHL